MVISREKIIDARIIRLAEMRSVIDGGLDLVIVYFEVDRGFWFRMPISGLTWESTPIPSDASLVPPVAGLFSKFLAKSVYAQQAEAILGRAIRAVLADPGNAGNTALLLDNNSMLFNTLVSPHGTGAAGLYHIYGGEVDVDVAHMKDFFSSGA